MEPPIGSKHRLHVAGCEAALLILNRSTQPLEIVGRGAFRRQIRETRLEHLTRLGDVNQMLALPFEKLRQGLGRGPRRRFADEIAAALARDDHPGELERAQRFPNRSAAGAEEAGQLTFGRQLVARPEFAAPDLFLQPPRDLLVNLEMPSPESTFRFHRRSCLARS